MKKAGLLKKALCFVSQALAQSLPVTMTQSLLLPSPRAPPCLSQAVTRSCCGIEGLCVSGAAGQPINHWGPALSVLSLSLWAHPGSLRGNDAQKALGITPEMLHLF